MWSNHIPSSLFVTFTDFPELGFLNLYLSIKLFNISTYSLNYTHSKLHGFSDYFFFVDLLNLKDLEFKSVTVYLSPNLINRPKAYILNPCNLECIY